MAVLEATWKGLGYGRLIAKRPEIFSAPGVETLTAFILQINMVAENGHHDENLPDFLRKGREKRPRSYTMCPRASDPVIYLAMSPPSTTMLVPVTKLLAELAKNTTTPRKSSGRPHLPAGVP